MAVVLSWPGLSDAGSSIPLSEKPVRAPVAPIHVAPGKDKGRGVVSVGSIPSQGTSWDIIHSFVQGLTGPVINPPLLFTAPQAVEDQHLTKVHTTVSPL